MTTKGRGYIDDLDIMCAACDGLTERVQCPDCGGTGELYHDRSPWSVDCRKCASYGGVHICRRCAVEIVKVLPVKPEDAKP